MSEPHRIRCAEIWGGISLVDTDVCTRGLSASILSAACGSNQGGDIYYFSVCSSDLLSRVAIADMRGHGEDASRLSGMLFESLQRRMNTTEGNGVLEDLNEEVRAHGFAALTTAAVLSYYVATSKLYFSYAGHPPILLQQVVSLGDSCRCEVSRAERTFRSECVTAHGTTRTKSNCGPAIASSYIRTVSLSVRMRRMRNSESSGCSTFSTRAAG